MIKVLRCTDPAKVGGMLKREEDVQADVDAAVASILSRVKEQGDRALLHYTEQFDGVKLKTLQVTDDELAEAFTATDPAFIRILEQARDNIRDYHQKQKRQGFVMDEKPGVVLGQKITPLDRVGIYVPGGTARYPSTVLMDAIPAQIAGVGEIVMVSPPGKDGNIPADILAAAKVAGVNKIFKLGGAQAVAALSYGTESVPKVDKIVGPGNIFVATAKRMVYGLVDIDMIAGPSEILVIADDTANPRHVAADLLSQAEHDRLAASFLVTASERLAEQVARELEVQLQQLPRQEMARHSIDTNGAIFITDTLVNAVAISNEIAPEHLEVSVDEPFALLSLIKHAGSIFLGKYAPEALGDYMAGPNHTLPTSGTARFSSALSVDDYVKKSSFLYYERSALEQIAGDIAAFARREGLDAHARSVEVRFE